MKPPFWRLEVVGDAELGYALSMKLTCALLVFCGALPVVLAQKKEQTDPRLRELRTYLRENFGMSGYETSWYKAITDVRIAGDTAIAQVNPPSTASAVCSGISGFVYDRTRSHKLVSVRIVDSKNRDLFNRRSVAGQCK